MLVCLLLLVASVERMMIMECSQSTQDDDV